MSKPVKQLIIDMYRRQFEGVSDAVLIDLRGVAANDNNALRSEMAQKQVRITVVKNSLAKRAFEGTGLEPIGGLLEGPSAVVTGGESVVSVARDLAAWAKKLAKLELKGAVMEGTVFGADEMERLAKFPTRVEAQAQVIQLVLGPAGGVISAAASAGSNIAGILDALIEKLEKGEAVGGAAA